MKLFVQLSMSLFVVLPVYAQATPGPITAVLGGTGQYVRWLTAAFDSIPESKYAYKPTPIQRSVGDSARARFAVLWSVADLLLEREPPNGSDIVTGRKAATLVMRTR